jgi:hypothetical protein
LRTRKHEHSPGGLIFSLLPWAQAPGTVSLQGVLAVNTGTVLGKSMEAHNGEGVAKIRLLVGVK